MIARSVFLILIGVFQITLSCLAQWGVPYSNHWISYDQQYLKITVTENGLYRIPLGTVPQDFLNANKDNLQLFHRGREVSIIDIDDKGIIFYGVLNDGSSDSLFYRPMSSRLNQYSSLYSDQSSYFLTIGKTRGKRIIKIPSNATASLDKEPFHIENNLTVNKTQYSLSSEIHVAPDYLNSFFEKGASRTGERLLGDTLLNFPFQILDLVEAPDVKPRLRILLHGMSNNTRGIEIYAGRTNASLRILGTLKLTGFEGKIFEFDLEQDDFNPSGEGVISLKSNSKLEVERFSIGFQSITFPQKFSMQGLKTKTFELSPTSKTISKFDIDGLNEAYLIYDVSNVDEPTEIVRNGSEFTVPRTKLQKLLMFATNEIKTIESTMIAPITFNKINQSDFNYIIITNELLTEVSNKYAVYRSSSEGGGYKPIVIKIKDIYNQFNFGEISPVAIRRFVDYMVADGNKNKHLFLIGKSINPIEKMPKNLEECVPAVGYPGSDILLVEGLAGSKTDVPVIPVGRLMANTVNDVEVYLNKIEKYEQNSADDLAWRKRILHLNGGHDATEISQFRDVLAGLAHLAEDGPIGGDVKAVIKQTSVEVEDVNVTPEVNAGVGMFTYFGHGSRNKTDLDFGYVSDLTRGYSDNFKYPLMYFNGCGVGNIFRGLFNTTANSSDRRPISLDWMLSPNRGAIAIIANSYYSYLSPTLNYLEKLYGTLFTDEANAHLSIGNIQREVISKIMTDTSNSFDVTNVHQSVLQGDPALHLFNLNKADFSIDPNHAVFLSSNETGKLIGTSKTFLTGVITSNLGKYDKGMQVPISIKYIYENGKFEVISKSFEAIPYLDTLYFSYTTDQKIKRVEVVIDEENKIIETSKVNNRSVLVVDWEIALNQIIYPATSVKDFIAPILSVNYNNRTLRNNATLSINPNIEIILEDDNFLEVDSSLISISLKGCGDESCDFVKIPFTTDYVIGSSITNYMVKFTLNSKNFTNGTYELLINARDLAGNAVVIPYRIRFQISDLISGRISVISSPNPASTYVKFSSSGYPNELLKKTSLIIYDPLGNLLEIHTLDPASNEWYWFPQKAGLQLYKISFYHTDGELEEVKGKIVVVK